MVPYTLFWPPLNTNPLGASANPAAVTFHNLARPSSPKLIRFAPSGKKASWRMPQSSIAPLLSMVECVYALQLASTFMVVGGASTVPSGPKSGPASGPAGRSTCGTSSGASGVWIATSVFASEGETRSKPGPSAPAGSTSIEPPGPSKADSRVSTIIAVSPPGPSATPPSGDGGGALSAPPSRPHGPATNRLIDATALVSPAFTATLEKVPCAITQPLASRISTVTVAVPPLPAGK